MSKVKDFFKKAFDKIKTKVWPWLVKNGWQTVNAIVLIVVVLFPFLVRPLVALWLGVLSVIGIAKLLKKTKPIEE